VLVPSQKEASHDEPNAVTIALGEHAAAQGRPMSTSDQDFVDFVGSRWSPLYRLAYLLAGSPAEAEDLLQTTLEKAYVRWPRIRQMDHPEAYVRRMLATGAVSTGRRAWIRERPSADLPEPRDTSDGVAVLDRALLWPLVCALPARQRAIVVLRYYEDLTEAQIADVLGCARGTVKSQASAAMKALRRALGAADVEEAVES
jgi:RNA polymerase sigma-70 factor (sigma-E family)